VKVEVVEEDLNTKENSLKSKSVASVEEI